MRMYCRLQQRSCAAAGHTLPSGCRDGASLTKPKRLLSCSCLEPCLSHVVSMNDLLQLFIPPFHLDS